MGRDLPGREGALPPLPPLRTVLETFASYGSSSHSRRRVASPERYVAAGSERNAGRTSADVVARRSIAWSPFAGPRGSHPTCPVLGCPGSVLRVTHQVRVSSLSAWARRPYPPGYVFPVPFGGRRSLLGPSCARCGFGPFFRRWSGLPACAGPQRGCHVSHQGEALAVGVFSTAGPRCPIARPCTETLSQGAHYRRVSHPFRRPVLTQPRQRFTRVHPCQLSLARLVRMVRSCLGLQPSAVARPVTGTLARFGNRRGHTPGSWLVHDHSTRATSCRKYMRTLYHKRAAEWEANRTRTRKRQSPQRPKVKERPFSECGV